MTENRGLPRDSDSFVTAFARGLAVIRAFRYARHGLNITQVAQRAEVSPASARRLLHTLVALGYVHNDEGRFYLLPRVLELGFSYFSSLTVRDIAQPLIHAFTQETGQVCTLSVLAVPDVIYVARPELPSPLERSLTIGERLPAHATSSGHVLLTGLSEQGLEQYLTQSFERFTAATLCTKQALYAAVMAAKQNGYALASEQLKVGVCGLAVPIFDEEGNPTVALTISINLAQFSEEEIKDRFLGRLQQMAKQISHANRQD